LTDIPAWCRIEGHEVVQSGERNKEFFVRLRVAPFRVLI
jgi:TusA-related sulfurtransferase